MADYNIFIRTDNSNEQKFQTSPWKEEKQQQTSPWKINVQQAMNTAQNPDSLISQGISMIQRAVPAIAIAYAAIKLTDYVITAVDSFFVSPYGDQRFNTNYNNFKVGVRTVLNPFGSTINALKQNQNMKIENQKREQHLELMGDTEINRMHHYGV